MMLYNLVTHLSVANWIVIVMGLAMWMNLSRFYRIFPEIAHPGENDPAMFDPSMTMGPLLAWCIMGLGSGRIVWTVIGGLLIIACSFSTVKRHSGSGHKGWKKLPFLPGRYFDGDFDDVVHGYTLRLFVSGRKQFPVEVEVSDEHGDKIIATAQVTVTALIGLPSYAFHRHISSVKRSVQSALKKAMPKLEWPTQESPLVKTDAFGAAFASSLTFNDGLDLRVDMPGIDIKFVPIFTQRVKGLGKVWPKLKAA